MSSSNVVLEKMLTIDAHGIAKAPDIRQLQDKDVALLYSRDNSTSKTRYIAEVGVIYYMGDPKSPPKQRGLSEKECLKEAIENYNLAKDYIPDTLVAKLINKYYISNITEAGMAVESLQRSVHLSTIAANRINEILNKKLSGDIADEEVSSILTLMDSVNKRVIELPNLTKALIVAYENLRDEKEEQIGRGKQLIQSSMDADEED